MNDRVSVRCASGRDGASAISVTAIVATYNRAHLVGDTIDSLLAQSRPLDQLIVVNDGSTNATRDVLERYGERILHIEQANAGKSAALNTALSRVTSTHVWFFDDDDIALPEAVATHVRALANHPECDFTYSPNYYFSGNVALERIRASPALRFPDIPPAEFFLWIMQARFLPTHMQGMLIANQVIREVGPFDESLLRSQDRDMVLRIARRATPCRIDAATWAMRRHDGERGPGFAPHKATDSYAAWWHYRPRIFRKLRATLELQEYFPKDAQPSAEAVAIDPVLQRHALLQRAAIMATHGLFDEARLDLAGYAAQSAISRGRPTAFDRRTLVTLTDVPSGDQLPPASFYFCLGKAVATDTGRVSNAAKGMLWSATRMRRKKEYRGAAYTLTMGPVLLTGALAGLVFGTARHR